MSDNKLVTLGEVVNLLSELSPSNSFIIDYPNLPKGINQNMYNLILDSSKKEHKNNSKQYGDFVVRYYKDGVNVSSNTKYYDASINANEVFYYLNTSIGINVARPEDFESLSNGKICIHTWLHGFTKPYTNALGWPYLEVNCLTPVYKVNNRMYYTHSNCSSSYYCYGMDSDHNYSSYDRTWNVLYKEGVNYDLSTYEGVYNNFIYQLNGSGYTEDHLLYKNGFTNELIIKVLGYELPVDYNARLNMSYDGSNYLDIGNYGYNYIEVEEDPGTSVLSAGENPVKKYIHCYWVEEEKEVLDASGNTVIDPCTGKPIVEIVKAKKKEEIFI